MIKKWKEVECPEFIEGQYFTYILCCNDYSYYIGSSSNLAARIKDHKNERGASWTRVRLPVYLVYFEKYDSLVDARKREKQIKGWSRIKKEKLISGEWRKL